MATFALANRPKERLSLAAIDATVSAQLGPTRVPGNEQPACFNRQLAMYLGKHVGRWSTTQIGRFYNGRDHSTVCYGIHRIASLRESDPEVDVLLTQLTQQLSGDCADVEIEHDCPEPLINGSRITLEGIADLIAQRIWVNLEERLQRRL